MRTVNDFELELSAFVRSILPDCPVTYNGGHVGLRHRVVAAAYTQFELETLPSGGWGYMYFPVTGRYARTLGPAVVGTTGKFHTTWGDFHSTKNEAALEYEVFRMLAQGAGCSIGDQLHPRGVLDPGTYALVGRVYAHVAEKEPWCAGAVARTDIAVLNPEENLGGGVMDLPPGIQGAVRMLVEGGHQFDVIDSAADLSRYRLLVLPDHIRLTPVFAVALRDYLDAGGAVVASFESGLWAGRDEFALDEWGVRFESGGTWEHYISHLQAPSTGETCGPAAVRRGRVIYFCHPIHTQYETNAPLWVTSLFLNAIDLLLPDPLVRHGGPSTLEVSVTHQPEQRRDVLHLLHYIPERRGSAFDTVEDVLPVFDIDVSLRARPPVRGVCGWSREASNCRSARTAPGWSSPSPGSTGTRWSPWHRRLSRLRLPSGEHAEFVALRVGEHHPALVVALPDVHPGRAEAQETLDFGLLIVGVEIDVQPVLDRLGLGHRDEHQSRVGVVVLGHGDLRLHLEDDVVAQNLGPPPRQPVDVVRVDHDRIPTARHGVILAEGSRPRQPSLTRAGRLAASPHCTAGRVPHRCACRA